MKNNIRENLIVHKFPCLEDNYGYLVHDLLSGKTAAIDAPDANEIEKQLKTKEWSLDYIYNTHHHPDHIGGNRYLKEKYHCEIYASKYDSARIPCIDHTLDDNDSIKFGDYKIKVMTTPGHTLGHIIYFFEDTYDLFCGDTLFVMGCGRLFEGSPSQMWHSINKITALPDETQIYCSHEYTLANARFADAILKHNKAIKARFEHVKKIRAEKKPTIPTTLAEEKKTNPFLLASLISTKKQLDMPLATDEECFAHLRQLKDSFNK